MATRAVHVQGNPVVIPQQRHPPANLSSIKSLAITQLVIGVLTVIIGVAITASLSTETWSINTAAGIWAGGWIAITGIVGVSSIRNYSYGNLNGVYMAFNIISTCASALAGLFFIVAVAYYATITSSCYNIWNRYRPEHDCENRHVGLGLHIPLLILMIVEFFVSIIAAVFCCQNGCGGSSQTGIIIQQSQPQVSVLTTGGQTVMTSGGYPGGVAQYPGQMVPQYGQMVPQYVGQMAPQYNPQMLPAYSGQPMVTQAQYSMQTNEKPPTYDATPN